MVSMTRQVGGSRTWGAVVTLCSAAALTACGGRGVSTQGGTPTSRVPSASADTTVSTTATPVTTGFGTAQPAVDVVVAMLAAYNLAARSPQAASTAGFDKYLVGPAKATYDSSFAAAKKAGLALKGTPDGLRITIASATSVGGTNLVDLINCPLRSTTDPAVTYYMTTGAPFVASSAAGQVDRPWPTTFKLFQANGTGPWKITSAQTNTSQTCDQ